ncbi:phosphotransferase family enzyme [Dinghuibacter silviterrae]|uniref:Phosphotransferase family enzyme n=2 Tax=Dinghuibacter silviterrae TaxID=1539049 RepID=A0A4V3GKP2_9BACT|nr:phosphotransferase family enzyme [Dinghuibacter silviterrae]
MLPPQYLLDIVEDMVGKKSTRWTVPDCGLSAALRYSVQFEDNSRVFVKAATDDDTEEWLRTEHFVLSSLRESFIPHVIGWVDTPPVLISQDLSHAYWPASHGGTTWRAGDMELLLDGLKVLSSVPAPPGLQELQNRKTSIWSRIAGDPEALLRLKICPESWLEQSIDALIKAEVSLDVTGEQLVHGDVRSDNICFLDGQIVFVDWSHASRGYGRHDLATLLPTLHLEGGPAPYLVMPDGGGEAAMGCAGHIYRLSADRQMPDWLKNVFKRLIAIELQWAAQCLELDAPF